MRGLVCVTLGITMLAAAPVMAQPVGSSPKTVQLSKVIEDDQSYEPKVRFKVGTICLLSGKFNLTKQKVTLAYERFENLFAEDMKKAGFGVVATSEDLFASDKDKNSADYLIGANTHPDTIDICSSINGVKGKITVAVEWQLYDRKAQKVVETIVTTGTGTVDKFDRSGSVTMYNNAFVANLDELIAKGVLQKYVGLPAPVPPAPPAPIPAAAAAPAATVAPAADAKAH